MTAKGFSVRIVLVVFALVSVFSVLSWRLIQLQFKQHEHFSEVVRKKHVTREELPARRGAIMDRNGALLVSDKPVRDVVIDFVHLNHLPYAQRAISLASGISKSEVAETYTPTALRKAYLS